MKAIILIFTFILSGCITKNNSYWFTFFDKFFQVQKLKFYYGENIHASTEGQSKQWGLSFTKEAGQLCLYSHPIHLWNRELGPKLRLCLDDSASSENLLKESIQKLNLSEKDNYRINGKLFMDGKEIQLEIVGLTEIKSRIQEFPKDTYFFSGESKFSSMLLSLKYSPNESLIIRENEFGFSSNFYAPYFSVSTNSEQTSIYFPTNRLITSANNMLYLVLTTKDSSFHEQATQFIKSISQKNVHLKNTCQSTEFKITEILNYTNSSIGRFWELKAGNSDLDSVCFGNIEVQTGGKTYNYKNQLGFVFKESILVFREKEGDIEGIPFENIRWSDMNLSTVTKVDDKFVSISQIQPFPIQSIENTLYSNYSEYESVNCTHNEFVYSELSNVCASPGIDQINIQSNQCSPNDFQITEINSYGMNVLDSIDKTAKFIELQYIGERQCNVSSLSLITMDKIFPISSKSKIIQPQELLVISSSGLYLNSNLFAQDISDLKLTDSIQISNHIETKLLWSGLNSNIYFAEYDKNQNIYSAVFVQGKLVHHPSYHSYLIKDDLGNIHNMSPGEVILVSPIQNPQAILTEVSFHGSYFGTEPVSDDRFIEILSGYTGSIEIQIKTTTEQSVFIVPVISKEWNVLSSNQLKCFPDTSLVVHKDFSINDQVNEIELLYPYTNQSIFKKRFSMYGKSDTTNKVRTSLVFTGYSDYWKESSANVQISNECKNHTFASPNLENNFEPEFIEVNKNPAFLTYQIIGPNITKTSYNVRRYTILPIQEMISLVNVYTLNQNKYIDLNTPSGFFSSALVYQQLDNYSDLKSYNVDGIYIQSIKQVSDTSSRDWILLCNHGNESRDLLDYEIADSQEVDRLEIFSKRNSLYSIPNPSLFSVNTSILHPNSCAYILSPNATELALKTMGTLPTLILTVATSDTIGSGLSAGEQLDLYKYISGVRVHVHSFGNRFSHNPFVLSTITNEILSLYKNKTGERPEDYEVLSW